MASIPDRVQIGPYSFSIEFNKEANDAANSWGRVIWESQKVQLLPTVESTKLAEVLLHEVLHGVIHTSGLTKTENEEQFILATSAILLDTMRRNPGLVEFLMTEGAF